MWFWKLSKRILNRNITLPKSGSPRGTSDLRNSERWTHSTIDPSDVKHFSLKNKDWWDIEGSLKLLHSMNRVRIPLIRDYFTLGTTVENEMLPLKEQKVLDVGCGGGIVSEDLAKLGANVTGIDASTELIQVAEEHKNVNPVIADNKPTYYTTTIEEHAKVFENYYDGVVASEVIEHVSNPELFVRSCVQALKPGGKIIFTTPIRTRWTQFLLIFFCENVIKVIPKGTHQYEKFLTPEELTFLIERNNCAVEGSTGMSLNLVTGIWKTTNSRRTVFALQASKLK